MNRTVFLTAAAALTLSLATASAQIRWTHRAEEGEDATSRHYYFFASDGDSIQRVRWVWNGGAQNPPAVTDYLLAAGRITIRHLAARREDLAALTAGQDTELELQEESVILTRSCDPIPSPPATSLSERQRFDLRNLIDLLAKERRALGSDAD